MCALATSANATKTAAPDYWARMSRASRGCRVGCKIRWMHIPKCGSTFEKAVRRYACDDSAAASCPRMWPQTGHEPLTREQYGFVVGNFRHPRARMASFCRRHAHHELQSKEGMLRCLADTLRHKHYGIVVRLLTGHRLPNVGNDNSPISQPSTAAQMAMLREALRVLRHGFAFVGLTEAWQASLQLFHERFLPGVGVERTEIEGEGHVSPIVGTVGEGADGSSPAKGVPGLLESQYAIVRRRRLDPSRRPASHACAPRAPAPPPRVCACGRVAKPPRRCSQSQSNTVYTDLLYDQHWFPAAAERSVVESDPDLVVFAYARLAFCCRVHESGAELPTPCFRSLGAKVVGSRSEQRAWASHLLHGAWANATVFLDSPPIPAVLASLAGEDLSPIIEGGSCW